MTRGHPESAGRPGPATSAPRGPAIRPRATAGRRRCGPRASTGCTPAGAGLWHHAVL